MVPLVVANLQTPRVAGPMRPAPMRVRPLSGAARRGAAPSFEGVVKAAMAELCSSSSTGFTTLDGLGLRVHRLQTFGQGRFEAP